MKTKIFVLWLFCIFFSFCAGTSLFRTQRPYEELHTYENITVDHLWRCSRQALENIGFIINKSYQDVGFIEASWREKEERYRAPNDVRTYVGFTKRPFPPRSAFLTLYISESSGKVTLLCEAKTGGGPHTESRYKKNKDEAKRFFNEVGKILIKQ